MLIINNNFIILTKLQNSVFYKNLIDLLTQKKDGGQFNFLKLEGRKSVIYLAWEMAI